MRVWHQGDGQARSSTAPRARGITAALLATLFLAACSGESGGREQSAAVQSCMLCHNGSPDANDYSGPGIENPHPFGTGSSAQLLCTTCHGGNPNGTDKLTSHVPPPPEIGDRAQWQTNAQSYFNRLTRAGLDTYADYQVDGKTWSALDFLQFVNPGDLRVVTEARGCGQCHGGHAECVNQSVLATSTGIFSGALFSAGVDNAIPAHQGLYEDTASDLSFRAVSDDSFSSGSASVGAVADLLEFPVFSRRFNAAPDDIFNNDAYLKDELNDDRNADNSLVTGSPLAKLYHEQIAFTCGDCHLGSSGANNRAGDFRSSGCTACHMPYSLGGRSGSGDPNIDPNEPLDPDDIDEPELPHVARHMVLSVAKTLPGGELVQGIDDHACAGCHQGSNRTVMQYWGIRLDQNRDVQRGKQYPANPASFRNTNGDTRLFDPVVGNDTFNGRNRNQYLLFEDYDGDGRDDTPADVHHEAGLGCIDCHGGYDLHGGDPKAPNQAEIPSRMEQAVAVRCESCHGSVEAYADTVTGTTYEGTSAQVAVDANGRPMRHVTRDTQGDYWLKSRLTGDLHYIVQTRDTVIDTGRTHPVSGDPIYSERASYAMGTADGASGTGIGPMQHADVVGTPSNFTHMQDMSCASCHASWTNNCIGCHLGGEYNTGNNFSNITGERIVFKQANADFVYQSPVFFQLGVGQDDKIGPIAPNTDAFFVYEDKANQLTDVFAFTDRNGGGANTLTARFPSLAHNVMMPHSIRGKVSSTDEGPRYCVACHLTDEGLASWGSEYATMRTALATGDFASLDYDLLKQHIGQNTGNQLNSPLWVHNVAGLGSGLFLFDEKGCPVNPLDTDNQRIGCGGQAPATRFPMEGFTPVVFDLDRIVEADGSATGSNSHAMLSGTPATLRDAPGNGTAGPLGSATIERLVDPSTGIVLDSWLDADSDTGGQASDFVSGP